jgi:cell division protease FtsH
MRRAETAGTAETGGRRRLARKKPRADTFAAVAMTIEKTSRADRIVRAWQDRPEWMHSPVVVGLTASLLVLLALFAASVAYLGADRPGQGLTLDQYRAALDQGRVKSVEFRDEDAVAVGRLEAGAGGVSTDEVPAKGGEFSVAYPRSGVLLERLVSDAEKAGARVSVDGQGFKAGVRLVTTFLLPLMILANLFALAFLLMRTGGGALSEIETFGTLGKGRKGQSATPSITFADVAGADEAVEELKEVVDYLKDPTRYASVGAVPPKGVLLFGPPGCGKTLIARAVAGEAGVPFFNVAGAEFVESLVGVGAARVRDLFAKVREVAPAIVFIDELDAAARRRGAGAGGGGSDEREQTLNQLLVEIDGFDVSSGLVVIGATNRPDILDPAVLRPGRFDRHVTVDQPDHEGRLRILQLHARGKPMSETVDLDAVARSSPGFTGADLANVINEAALLTVRARRDRIEDDLLAEAVQRVLHGPQRRGRVLTPAERERAAVHESGHAIVAAAVGRGEDVHRISILTRGRGLGLTSVRMDSDAVLFTRDDLFDQLAVSFGGVAAEELRLGQSSTGAEQDFEHATFLAREIAGRYGMSERLGRVRLLAHDADEFLGATAGLQAMSERTHEAFDDEVRRLLEDAEATARDIVDGNRSVLDDLVGTLLERETLEGPPLHTLLEPVAAPKGNGHARVAKGTPRA